MISSAFFVASMVGFHVDFSQSMYSSKCPYTTCMYVTSVTGPSEYWRTSSARAFIVVLFVVLLLGPRWSHAVAARVRDRLPQMLVLVFENVHHRVLLRPVPSEQLHRGLQVMVGESCHRLLQIDVG